MKGVFEIIHNEVRYSLEGYQDKFYVEDMTDPDGGSPSYYMYLSNNQGRCILISDIDLEDALTKSLDKYKRILLCK